MDKVLNQKLIDSAYFKKDDFLLFKDSCINFLKQISENSIDMIFADPPYNLSNGGFSVHAGKRVSVNKGKWDESKGVESDFAFHTQWIEECHRILIFNLAKVWI